jgi:HEAT repeat protein
MGAPYIVKALQDSEIEVQHSAYRILNQLDGRYGLPRSGGPALTAAGQDRPSRDGSREGIPEPAAPQHAVERIYPADIIPRLSDSSDEVRERAGELLVSFGDAAFLPLVYAAYHPEPAMRIGALRALVRFGDRSVPYLVRALDDPDLPVQHEVYRILAEQDGRFGLPRVGGESRYADLHPGTAPLPEPVVPAAPDVPAVSLEGITDPAELAGYLDHASKDVQMNAAMALAMMGSPAIPALIDAFAAGRDARTTAAEVLGSLGPDAVGPLIAALADPRIDVASGAASVLGKLGDRRAVPALIPLLAKNAGGSGIVAAEALGYLGDSESVGALIAAMNGDDSELQGGAARALGYIGDERAVSSLIEAMGSEDLSLRHIAIEALTGIGEGSIPYLTEALLHSERGVRAGAAECFAQMGYSPKTEQERLSLLVANEEWLELARTGTSAVDILVHFTDDANEEVRAGAVAALGRVGGSRAVEVLGAILAADDAERRREAIAALAEMGPSAVPDLLKLKDASAHPGQQEAIARIVDRLNRKGAPGTASG